MPFVAVCLLVGMAVNAQRAAQKLCCNGLARTTEAEASAHAHAVTNITASALLGRTCLVGQRCGCYPGRHPLTERVVNLFVPNDTVMDRASERIQVLHLVLSNTGAALPYTLIDGSAAE